MTGPPEYENGLSIFGLLVELQYSTGGVVHTMQVDGFPGFTLHVAADTISGRLLWQDYPLTNTEAEGLVSWQLTRGMCPTTATRSFYVENTSYPPAPKENYAPLFATHFALYSPTDLRPEYDSEGWQNSELKFKTSPTGALVHSYIGDALLGTIGEFIPIPRGGRYWEIISGVTADFQIVFAYGARL